jgi:hypothetical protein
MGEIVETLIAATEFSGNFKLVVVTATILTASDTIILTEAQTGIQAILAPVGAVITAGMDADFQALQVSVSSMTITIVSTQADGAAADEFTGTTVAVTVIGRTSQ